MKKILKIIAAMVIVSVLFNVMITTAVFAEDSGTGQRASAESLSWSYDSTTKTLTISGTGEMEDCFLPRDNPFWECKDEIESVVITSGVTSIGNLAFYDYSSLTSITIPSSVTHIGDFAIWGCTSLTSITIPSSVTSIGHYALIGCGGCDRITVEEGNPVYDSRDSCNAIIETSTGTLLIGCKNTEIPWGMESIADFAFLNCVSLEEIEIPDSVWKIGNGAFENCAGLKEIEIPDGVEIIGDVAFYNCVSLEEIEIPDSVWEIGEGAFYDCVSLEEIEIPDGVEIIRDFTFHDCVSLEEIEIPDSVWEIGYSAFENCSSLKEIKIPPFVEIIKRYAFEGCSGLMYVTIGNGIDEIRSGAFRDCCNLADVYYTGTEANRDEIIISENNEALTNACWHYNNSGVFTDVYKTDWFCDSVLFVKDRGIMTGMGGTSNFAPYDPLHREQLAVMLYRLEGQPETQYQNIFPDVPEGTWYTLPIIWAYENGIITGYQSGYFGVGDNITREQLAEMLYRYAENYKHLDVSAKADISDFTDAASVSSWAYDAISWAVGNGIITGKDNGTRIDPQGNAARCECAAMFQRFMNKYGL